MFVWRKSYEALEDRCNYLSETMSEIRRSIKKTREELENQATFNRKHYKELREAQARLARIAALETPNCASIGKRMARIARGDAE